MDIVGTTLSVAQTLFAALQCSEVNETLSLFGYKSDLDDLIRTVEAVKAVLLDAESKKELSHEAQVWLQELKDAVYEADDLVDEFVTLAEQKQLLKEDGVSLSRKARHFFSNSNPLGIAFKMSRGVKKMKKKLGAIAYNDQFRFKLDHDPIRKRRPETCSYVDATDIIGREDDLENIIGMLLDSNVQRDVSFLTIVGMGGLGKTALAQLVYNDERVRSEFPLRLWACVSDHDPNQLDVKEIVGKILGPNHEDSTMDRLQLQLREKLACKRFLLVLDDVWTENRTQWNELAKFLIGDQRGSWIVATTRSESTAKIVGNGTMHKLQGLSQENSWRLFERSAFGSEQSNPHNDDLVEIGYKIVHRCAQIPLAIKVVGSILYGQDKSKWLSFQDVGLANIRESHNDIMPVLKFSYHHLESPLKCCFSYCAVFPKDYIIGKKMLLRLWMAQGYIVPIDKGQSIEDAGEEYITILSRRCFFHRVAKSADGKIESFMIHDLMHDIAQSVMGKELCTMKTARGNLDKKVRHLSLARSSFAKYSFSKTHIRSYYYAGHWRKDAEMDKFTLEAIVTNCRWLRTLDLAHSMIKSLPNSIGGLLHLRYLDLSYNQDLEVLPKSIANLYNLQTLLLARCGKLKELPKDLSNLVKLETLDIDGCSSLSFMPKGIDKLTCLRTLSKFIVGGKGSCSGWKQWFDRLEHLTALNNLKGHLDIDIRWPNNATYVQEGSMREGLLYLRHKEHLSRIKVEFKLDEGNGRINNDVERRLMEELQPHSNLKELVVRGYHGARMPSWVTILPNLVELRLSNCGELDYLPCLGNLSNLKVLTLTNLDKLEHIEEDISLVFPSLERLELKNLQNLKGWMRRAEAGDDYQLLVDSSTSEIKYRSQLCFPQLKSLRIERCRLLSCTPWCPKLERLHLVTFNKRLEIMNTERAVNTCNSPSCSFCDPGNARSISVPKLRVVWIDDVAWLNSLPMEAFRCLAFMTIKNSNVESLEVVEEVFRSCSSSLQSLDIIGCSKLMRVSGGIEHLTALEMLGIYDTHNLSLLEDGEDGMPWKSLYHSLTYIQLVNLPQLQSLPNWMQFLKALRTFSIVRCNQLESMPNWMPKLTSLRNLKISYCSTQLERRCRNPTGEDWLNIQHISSKEITNNAPFLIFLPLDL